jgi:hypothetical protein
MQRAEISVENPHFSTLSTGISTRVFHSGAPRIYTVRVDIIIFDTLGRSSHFFDHGEFHHSHFVCAKITPLTEMPPAIGRSGGPGRAGK